MTPQELKNKAVRYAEKYFELLRGYNKKQNDLLSRARPEFKNHLAEYVEKQIQEEIQKVITDTRKEVGDFVKLIATNLTEANIEKDKIKFPLRYAPDTNKNLIAENIYQRAFNFLNTAKDVNVIEAEIKKALDIDVNYFSSLIQLVNAKRPIDTVGQSNLEQDEVFFYRHIDEINGAFELRTGIKDLNEAVQSITNIQKKVNSFFNALIDNIQFYYDKDSMLKMSQDERVKSVDRINASAEYWLS